MCSIARWTATLGVPGEEGHHLMARVEERFTLLVGKLVCRSNLK